MLWDLTCEDGSRFKLTLKTYDKLKALEVAKNYFKSYEIELANWNDQGFKMARHTYELMTGMPYDGRVN